jgi:beta-exotoxin I transport system permease protein
MTATLVRKLLRDVRLTLAVVALLLGAFQVLWYKVVDRILGELSPFFTQLAGASGITRQDVEDKIFNGPGKIVRTIIGGEQVSMDRAMDLLSVGYVHPLIQTMLCVWAVGRAAGAIAGEIDRGTMELLLAQPLARFRLIAAHLCVDLITIPILCLSLWAGNYLGIQLIGPIKLRPAPELATPPPARPGVSLFDFGPFNVSLSAPGKTSNTSQENEEQTHKRLAVEPAEFGRALPAVGGLLFALSGLTLWLSAAGRFRWRVLGLAVFGTLLQFLINVIGQLDESFACLRPLTIFYYYRPQEMVLGKPGLVTLSEWYGGQPLVAIPGLIVLYAAGALGYLMALRVFTRRDIPAPL